MEVDQPLNQEANGNQIQERVGQIPKKKVKRRISRGDFKEVRIDTAFPNLPVEFIDKPASGVQSIADELSRFVETDQKCGVGNAPTPAFIDLDLAPQGLNVAAADPQACAAAVGSLTNHIVNRTLDGGGVRIPAKEKMDLRRLRKTAPVLPGMNAAQAQAYLDENRSEVFTRCGQAKIHLDEARKLFWIGEGQIRGAILDLHRLPPNAGAAGLFSVKAQLKRGIKMQYNMEDPPVPAEELADDQIPWSQSHKTNKMSALSELWKAYTLIRDYEMNPSPPLIEEVDEDGEVIFKPNPQRVREDEEYRFVVGTLRMVPNRLGLGEVARRVWNEHFLPTNVMTNPNTKKAVGRMPDHNFYPPPADITVVVEDSSRLYWCVSEEEFHGPMHVQAYEDWRTTVEVNRTFTITPAPEGQVGASKRPIYPSLQTLISEGFFPRKERPDFSKALEEIHRCCVAPYLAFLEGGDEPGFANPNVVIGPPNQRLAFHLRGVPSIQDRAMSDPENPIKWEGVADENNQQTATLKPPRFASLPYALPGALVRQAKCTGGQNQDQGYGVVGADAGGQENVEQPFIVTPFETRFPYYPSGRGVAQAGNFYKASPPFDLLDRAFPDVGEPPANSGYWDGRVACRMLISRTMKLEKEGTQRTLGMQIEAFNHADSDRSTNDIDPINPTTSTLQRAYSPMTPVLAWKDGPVAKYFSYRLPPPKELAAWQPGPPGIGPAVAGGVVVHDWVNRDTQEQITNDEYMRRVALVSSDAFIQDINTLTSQVVNNKQLLSITAGTFLEPVPFDPARLAAISLNKQMRMIQHALFLLFAPSTAWQIQNLPRQFHVEAAPQTFRDNVRGEGFFQRDHNGTPRLPPRVGWRKLGSSAFPIGPFDVDEDFGLPNHLPNTPNWMTEEYIQKNPSTVHRNVWIKYDEEAAGPNAINAAIPSLLTHFMKIF